MYDLIIIGGGPAGSAAGVYAARKRIKTVLLTPDFGGQSVVSPDVQNFIGIAEHHVFFTQCRLIDFKHQRGCSKVHVCHLRVCFNGCRGSINGNALALQFHPGLENAGLARTVGYQSDRRFYPLRNSATRKLQQNPIPWFARQR